MKQKNLTDEELKQPVEVNTEVILIMWLVTRI